MEVKDISKFLLILHSFSQISANIVFQIIPKSTVVVIGQNLALDCQVLTTIPGYNITHQWAFNDGSVQSKTSILANHSLLIPDIQQSDLGAYNCIAEGLSYSRHETTSPDAIVIEAFTNDFQENPKSVIISKEKLVAFSCLTGESAPTPELYWEKDGEEFLGGEQYNISVGSQGVLKGLSVQLNMTLWLLAMDDNVGNFSCVARNPMTGKIKKSTQAQLLVAVLDEHFKKQAEDTQVGLGGHITLPCHPPRSVPWVVVTWYKDNEPLAFSMDLERVKLSTSSGGIDLVISGLQYEDTGEYFCEVYNNYSIPSNRTSDVAQLTVFGPPILVEPPTPQQVIQLMLLHLKCRVLGWPVPALSWFLNGRQLTPTSRLTFRDSSQELWVRNMNKADEGTYMCRAENIYGSKTAQTKVNVLVPPVVMKHIGTIIAEEGASVFLNCKVYSDPSPTIFWSKDNESLATSDRLIMMSNGLQIANVSVADKGRYCCTAANVAGVKTSIGNLIVEVGPHFVTHPQDQVVKIGDSITFACSAKGEPAPVISWEFNNSVVLPSSVKLSPDGQMVLVSPVTWNEVGFYSCVAENIHGMTVKMGSLFVQTFPTVTAVDGNTVISTDDSLKLHCKSTGLPSDIQWLLNGKGLAASFDGRVSFPSRNSLLVKFVSKIDAGVYTCIVSNAVGNSSKMVTVYVIGNPMPPVLHDPQTVSATEVNLSWSPVIQDVFTNVTGYIIRYKLWYIYKPNFVVYKDNLPEGTTHLLVRGLEPSQSYVFSITAKNRVGEGNASGMKSATTFQSAPSAPLGFRTVGVTFDSVSLLWHRPRKLHGKVKKYQVYCWCLNWTQEQAFIKEIQVSSSPAVNHVVSGLHPYSTYSCKVRAATVEAGTEHWGNFSDMVSVTTEMAAPSGSPQNVSVILFPDLSAKLVWKPPNKEYLNGPLKKYYVKIESQHFEKVVDHQTLSVIQNAVNITGLLPWRTYSFSVLMENEIGSGPQSEAVKVQTPPKAPSGPPIDVVLWATSAYTVDIYWKPPVIEQRNCQITSYIIDVSEAGGIKVVMKYHIGSSTLSQMTTTIRHLRPWTLYKVRLAAYTDQVNPGEGPRTEARTVRTLEAAPGPVTNLTFKITAVSAQLAWQHPEWPNGIIKWYKIEYASINATVAIRDIWQENRTWRKDFKYRREVPKATAISLSGTLMTSNLTATISNLVPSTQYNVSVKAATSAGEGNSTSMLIDTLPPSNNTSSFPTLPTTAATITQSVMQVGVLGSPQPRPDSSLQDLPVIVAGSLTAGLVLLFLLGILLYRCMKTRRKRQKEQNYMMFYAYDDIGALPPDDPNRHSTGLQQTQLSTSASANIRKTISYGCKEEAVTKSKDSSDNREQKTPDSEKAISPSFVHHRYWRIQQQYSPKGFGGIENPGFEDDSSSSPQSAEDTPRLSAEELYSQVNMGKKKNRMRSESAAAIAVMRNSVIPSFAPDTETLIIHNESVVVYDERTAL